MMYREDGLRMAGRFVPWVVSTLIITLLPLCQDAFCQAQRPERGFYLTSRVGLSFYDGDNNEQLRPVFRAPNGASSALSFGGGYYIDRRWSIGLDYKVGNYPLVAVDSRDSRYYTLRHTAQALARFIPFHQGTVAPYVTAGFHITKGARIGHHADGTRQKDPVAYGPTLGAGIDISLNHRFSVILEAIGNIAYPDHAFDAVSGTAGAVDVFGFVGTGFRINIQHSTGPVRVAISGPQNLEAGTTGHFTATPGRSSPEPTHYEWNLGDGTLVEGASIQHAYFQPGKYTVTLRARDHRTRHTAVLDVVVTPLQIEDARAPELILGAAARCEELIDEAEAKYVSGRFAQAIDAVIPCLGQSLVPAELAVRIHRIRALAFSSDGNPAKAREEIERLLDADPTYQPDPVQDPPTYSSMVAVSKQRRAEAIVQERLIQAAAINAANYVLPADVLVFADELVLTDVQRAELRAVSDVVSDVEYPLKAALDEDRVLLAQSRDDDFRRQISERLQVSERQLRALYRSAQQQVLSILTDAQRTRFDQITSAEEMSREQ